MTISLKELETTDADVDILGIRKLYSDAEKDFQEWYMREARPKEDPRFQNWKNANLKPMQDGSGAFYVDGAGNENRQVRLEGWSKKGTYFLNGEVTAYVKYLKDVKPKKKPKKEKKDHYAAQLYLRGGHHSPKRGCEGACYKARLYKNGNTALVKEIQHKPDGYTSNREGNRVISGNIANTWVGMKLVVYNFQERSHGPVWVKIELWVDVASTDANGNLDLTKQQWNMAAETVDKGGWKVKGMKNPTKCPSIDVNSMTPNKRQPDEIITKPGGTKDGNLGALRTDRVALAFKHFSIREIQPPSKD